MKGGVYGQNMADSARSDGAFARAAVNLINLQEER
jgi:hypothetical protein